MRLQIAVLCVSVCLGASAQSKKPGPITGNPILMDKVATQIAIEYDLLQYHQAIAIVDSQIQRALTIRGELVDSATTLSNMLRSYRAETAVRDLGWLKHIVDSSMANSEFDPSRLVPVDEN